MASLTVTGGPSEGDYYPLGTRTVVIGRDEGATVQVLDDLVSRKHCQVRCEEDPNGNRRFQLLDMSSANGVNVNGRRVTEVWLENNDLIELGNSRIMFSTQNFDDRESALSHFKKRGERDRNTMIT